MKKFSLIFVFICIIVTSLCSCTSKDVETDSNQNSSMHDLENSTESSNDNNDKKLSLSEILIKEIDGAYYEESLNTFSSTINMMKLATKYSEKWEQVADEYYNKLMQYDDIIQLDDHYPSVEDFHNAIYNMKINWETYYETEMTNYNTVLETLHGAGTIRGPIINSHAYKLKMSWALKLVDICEQLGIE